MRDNYWSVLKGIAIIAVVFIHTPYVSDSEFVGLSVRQIVTFPVAFFVFLSGYFVKDESLKWKSVKRLLIPYLIWTILWFCETTITGSVPVTTWKIFNSIFLGGAFFPLYFLSVLLQLKLMTPFLYKRINVNEYKANRDLLWLITPIYLFGLYVWQIYLGEQPIVYAQLFPAWFIFYYLGIYLKKYPPKKMSPIVIFLIILICLYFTICETEFINFKLKIPFFAASQIKFSSFAYTIFICILFVLLHSEMENNLIARIGEASFGIYIIHIPVKMAVDTVISYCPIIFKVGLQNQIIVVVSTVLLCYLIIMICSCFLSEKLMMYLGLK